MCKRFALGVLLRLMPFSLLSFAAHRKALRRPQLSYYAFIVAELRPQLHCNCNKAAAERMLYGSFAVHMSGLIKQPAIHNFKMIFAKFQRPFVPKA